MSKKASIEVTINDEAAIARLEEIKNELRQIKSLRDLAFSHGDIKGFNQLNGEMKKLTREAKQMERQVVDVKKVLNNISGASIKELEGALKKANAEFKAMKRNDPGWKAKRRDVQLLQTELDKATHKSQTFHGLMDRMAYGFNKYFTMATGLIATFTGIAFSAQQWVKGLAGMDDALANVMKTTGLTRKEVRELYTEFRFLNTRTARKELLELAEEAGRLGKKSKKDVMDFVEVGNMIKVALGDDLKGDAAEAIKEVGKITNIYKVGAKYGTDFRDSMLMVGSAINEVSANSQAQAPFLIDMLKRMGGLADQADISAQNVIGYASALDQLGQTSEVSGTALNKTIINMFTDTATYAGIAKMEVNEFRNLLQTDANEALMKFLEGLNGNNEGLITMAAKFDGLGLDGARAIQVLAALASNTQLVRQEQALANRALEEGTSLTNEYNIKNENMAGNLEKIGRAIHAWFVNSNLNKSMESLVGWFAKLVRVPLEAKLRSESREVATLIGRLTDVNTKASERKTILEELEKINPRIVAGINKEKISFEQLATNVKAYNDEMVKRIVLSRLTEKEQEIMAKAAEAGAAAKDRELYLYELIMEVNSDIAAQHGTTEEKIKLATAQLIEMGASLDEYNKKSGITVTSSGQIVDNRSREQRLLDDIINAQSSRNKLLQRQNELESDASPIQKRIEAFKKMIVVQKEASSVGGSGGGDGTPTPETLEAARLRLESEKKAIESRLALLDESYEKDLAMLKQSFKEKRQAIELDLKFNKDLTAKDRANLNTALVNSKKLENKEAEKLKKDWSVKSLQINKELIDLEIAASIKGTVEEFELQIKLLDIQRDIELAQVKEHEEKKEEIKQGIIDKYQKQKFNLLKSRDINFLDEQFTAEITKLIGAQEKSLSVLNEKRSKGRISEENYRKELQRLQEDYTRQSLMLAIDKAEKELLILKAAGENTVDAEMQLAQLRLEIQSQSLPGKNLRKDDLTFQDYSQMAIDAAQNVSDAIFQIRQNSRRSELDAQLKALDEQQQAELSRRGLTEKKKDAINEKYRKKEAALKLDAWKKEQKASISQALINGALAIVKTFAYYGFTPAGIAAAAAQAIATGLQIAVIKKEKPPVFRRGGYTKTDLSDDEPAGMVHANEFVATAEAKRNPTVRPVLDAIDRAQRSGTIRSINLPAVMAVTHNGFKQGGYAPSGNNTAAASSPGNTPVQADQTLTQAMNRFADAVDKLQTEGVSGKWVYQEFKDMASKEESAIRRTG